jgi:hypothetical protein
MALTAAYSGPVGSPIRASHVLQRAGLNGLEAELTDELHHPGFLPASSPAISMTGSTDKSAASAILPAPLVLSIIDAPARD